MHCYPHAANKTRQPVSIFLKSGDVLLGIAQVPRLHRILYTGTQQANDSKDREVGLVGVHPETSHSDFASVEGAGCTVVV